MMPTRARLRLSVVAVLTACSFAHAQPEVAPIPHPALSELVKEYKRLGLPLLPPNAELVRIYTERYIHRGLEERNEQLYELAFRVQPVKPGERARYLRPSEEAGGLAEWVYVEPAAVEESDPTRELLRRVDWESPGYYLSLAVQCKERGWVELAVESSMIARTELAKEQEPRTARETLCVMAWLFWTNQRFERGSDRREVLRRLEGLITESPEFREPDAERVISALKLTVAPSRSKAGSIESLIDELIDYRCEPWSDEGPTEPASYWKLAELGFDAVPALIAHINDPRLTRAREAEGQFPGLRDVTVGHLCSRLLDDLSGRTIGGDSRQRRGARLQPKEVRKWFAKAQQVGEEKWLLEHAVPRDAGGPITNQEGRPEPHIIRALGTKYPNRLPAVYRALLTKSVHLAFWGDNFINPTELVLVSKLPREQKIALLEEGATSGDLSHRVLALEGLAQLDRGLLRKHLPATLNRIPARFWLWAEETPLDSVERLVALAESPACWDGLAEMYKAMSVEYRLDLLRYVQRNGPPDRADPHRRDYIRFLLRFIDDPSGFDERFGFHGEDRTTTRVCDTTASQLAGLLGFPVVRGVGLYWPVHDRTRGPFARAFFRATVWQAARRELAAKP